MAATATKGTLQIPESFAPDQLFVAVCDGLQVYAGDDGGPQHGGQGRWKVGEVGAWMADRTVPLAHRDPSNGLIWKGWLEACTQHSMKESGQLVSLQSDAVYSEPPMAEQRAMERIKAEGKMLPKAKAPTAKAVRRAKGGAAPMQDALKPASQRSQIRAAGIPLDEV